MSSYHYLYRITNLVEQKHYYGIRTTKNTLPQDDLGKKYFSSSVDKEFIKDQKEHPENYIYKIVITSDSRNRVADLEIKIHQKFNVGVNEKFYNRAIHTSAGFYYNSFGKVAVKDNFGNFFSVTTNDEKYLSGELIPVNKGLVYVEDQYGNILSISKTDPRYLNGSLVSTLAGKIIVCDHEGNNFFVSKNDSRYLNGSLVSVLTGKVTVRDHEGNTFSVSVDDKRYLDGELFPINKNMVTVHDDSGKCIRVSIDDERYLSGQLKHNLHGTRWIYNLELKQNKMIKPDVELPDGWQYGRKKFSD